MVSLPIRLPRANVCECVWKISIILSELHQHSFSAPPFLPLLSFGQGIVISTGKMRISNQLSTCSVLGYLLPTM